MAEPRVGYLLVETEDTTVSALITRLIVPNGALQLAEAESAEIFATGAMSNPMTTLGDIIRGGVAGAPQRLAIGTAGQVLTVVSGEAAWATPTVYQAQDSDLTAIAGLSPSNDDIIQRKAGAWVNRTVAQYKADLSLTNVTNDAQTKASVVPNTLPASGQILVGNAGGTAYAPVSVSGDVTISSAGVTAIGALKVTNAMLAGSNLLNAFTTLAESWIGPSTTNGIYFKAGNVGIGTTNPLEKLSVTGSVAFLTEGSYKAPPFNSFAQIGNDPLIEFICNTTADVIWGIQNLIEGTTNRFRFITHNDDGTGLVERLSIRTSTGIVKLAGTGSRGTTEGTNRIDIFNGTAPVGTLTNGISIYSASGIPTVMDASGNANGLGQASTPTFAGLNVNGTIGASANLTIAPTGDIILNPTGNDILPTTNYDLNLGSLSLKYLTLHAAELWVETLVAQDTIATIGGRILVGPTTVLTSDLTAVATTIVVKHNEMAVGDRIYMEAAGSVEFMAVTAGPTGTGPYSYTVTRNLDASGANAWSAGDAVFNTGTTGDGFIDLYSVRGVKASSEAGPTIVGNVRNSSTYNDWSPRWAIGNLNGLYGYGATTYGAAFGVPTGAWVKIDPTNGVRIGHNTTDMIVLDASGNGSFAGSIAVTGSVTAGAGDVILDPDGLTFIANTSSGFFDENSIKWKHSGTTIVEIYQEYNAPATGVSSLLVHSRTKATDTSSTSYAVGRFGSMNDEGEGVFFTTLAPGSGHSTNKATAAIGNTGGLTFDGLIVNGSAGDAAAILDVFGNIAVTGAEAASTPSIFKRGDPDTGIFFPAANALGIAAGGVEAARFSSTSLLLPGSLFSSSPTAGIGYTIGAGGAVTQATSKATGVTLNKVCGEITMHNAALAAAAKASFVVTNSAASATDGIMVWVARGGTANAYRANVTAVGAGSFTITVENITAGSLSEAPVIGFAIVKAING